MPRRPAPPMYGAVRRKVTPPQRQIVAQKQSEEDLVKRAAEASKKSEKEREARDKARHKLLKGEKETKEAKDRVQAAEKTAPAPKKAAPKKAAPKKAAPKKAAPKKAAPKKAAPKKAAPKKAAPKKAAPKKAATKIKWSEDMTQKALYAVAKKHGLDVRAKDWKHELIAALKKASK